MTNLPTLQPYMVHSEGAGSGEGACLVFARNDLQAKQFGHLILENWFEEQDWDDVCAVLITTNVRHLIKTESNPSKFADNITHSIESPKVCPNCEKWGGGQIIDGRCDYCETWET